ncbi:MAG: CusA/CzcA family heavy metal efflux RND transporter [Saprospiraceae bacterium]|nr:CusA/CzcA family heavy metal efflux RND transporter [Saprospiraceae bacterium]
MFDRIVHFSIHNKLIIAIFIAVLIGVGVYSVTHLSLDAVPDITDNQVQVITSSPDLSAQEVERLITYPLEMQMGNIPDLKEIRSISRFGLSVITIVFQEHVDIYWAREQINQRIQNARSEIPIELGSPVMGPISTGLGEVYQYVIYPEEGYEDQYGPTELRSIQDWIIKRQLVGVPGVVEVNSSGGYVKQFEIALNQDKLKAFGLSLDQIFTAVEQNNANAGGSYIEKKNQVFFIRGEGMVESLRDLENIVVTTRSGAPVLIRHLANVQLGHAPRFGAMTMNGKGEVVAGHVMMLKGENSMEVTKNIKTRIEQIKETLPEGVVLEPFLDRSDLVNRTSHTVAKNLIEGALIVIFILVLLLGNFRAGLIVASVIPISMLFAVSCMQLFGVSANLMSLGAIDFGLIVDGAVIMVEAILHRIQLRPRESSLSPQEKETEVYHAASNIRTSVAFGEIIILIVYVPIFFLQGVEGKMFIPMAQTVSFAILGAFILSLTYVPMMSALFLKNAKVKDNSFSNRIMHFLYEAYAPLRDFCFQFRYWVLALTLGLFIFSLWIFSKMGSEFIPTLEEGDFALHQILPPGSSILKSVEVSAKLQDILTSKFPEVEKVVTKIGTSEIPFDLMPLEAGDIFVILKPKDQWVTADNREDMFSAMETELEKYPGVNYEFTQPIQMRFNELMTGVRQDIAIKIYGEDLGVLVEKAHEAVSILNTISGVGDIKVEPTAGLLQMVVDYDRAKMAKYGISIGKVNDIIKASFGGKTAGKFYEGERRYNVVVRLREAERQDIRSLRAMHVDLPSGGYIPLSELAAISLEEGPTQISRDDTKRRIVIGVNGRNRDIASLIADIKSYFAEHLDLPPAYYVQYGGQFENLERAQSRLMIVVPLALLLIFLLLYFTFHSLKYALLIFTAIPLSAIGGIWGLYFRGMPFSISAGVGFVALFGVAVLNGIVLVAYFNELRQKSDLDLREVIRKGTKVRLRPVVMTAAVASLGFLPMAISGSAGAEVQRPLATVVICGLITATFLTLVIVPILYYMVERLTTIKVQKSTIGLSIALLLSISVQAQRHITLPEALQILEGEEQLLTQSIEWRKDALYARSQQPQMPLTWNFSISGEEFDFGNTPGIQSMNLQKNFRSPKIKGAYHTYYQVQQEVVQNRHNLDILQLKQQLANIYIDVAYLSSLQEMEEELLNTYRDFGRIATEKAALGEDSYIPSRQAQLETEDIEIMLQQISGRQRLQLDLMRSWLGDSTLSVTALDEVTFGDERLDLAAHPILQNLEVQRQSLSAQLDVQQALAKPQTLVGSRLQRVNGKFLFFGFQVGINVPFAGSYLKQQKSAFIAEEQALVLRQDWERKQIELRQRALYEERELLDQRLERISIHLIEHEALTKDVRKAYELGEIDYTDMVLSYQSYYALRKEQLELLRQSLLKLNAFIHYVNY